MLKSVEKTCKGCGVQFVVSCEVGKGVGSGGTNALRRVYHDERCKQEYCLQNSPIALLKSCLLCDAPFLTWPSTNCRYCSDECRHISHRGYRVPREIRACAKCDKEFETMVTSRQKYCDTICFIASQRVERYRLACAICGTIVLRRASDITSLNAFCKKECQNVGQSNGLIKIHIAGRMGRRVDLGVDFFRSALEADYARYLWWTQTDYLYQPETFKVNLDGEERSYTPDFYIPKDDTWIELKATRLKEDDRFSVLMNANILKVEALKAQKKQISVIYMNDFYKMLRKLKLYDVIPNLENRDYAGTRRLICSD